MSVAPVRPQEKLARDAAGLLHGSANDVPYAGSSTHLVVVVSELDSPLVGLVSATDCRFASGSNLAGEAQGAVDFEDVRPVDTGYMAGPDPLDALQRMGAAIRAQQMAGALERILDLSLEYARERVQFGRPIAASAIIRHGIDDQRTLFTIAAAKIRAGEAAGAGAAIAHQVHGAMGFTREYSLHHSTRRLWAWRDDFGAESIWAMRLGEIAINGGARALWPTLTSL
jgi:alkylation response protein AidB-like acyl-CoA dehydrogenase